ncbi:hypothetical protein, partial [Bacillus sp. JJ722]|uniref:hypothetical protein n=1 Tax=Bacillus sp. JJ722 TaxID=3122973 RepID=UPI002FFFDC21
MVKFNKKNKIIPIVFIVFVIGAFTLINKIDDKQYEIPNRKEAFAWAKKNGLKIIHYELHKDKKEPYAFLFFEKKDEIGVYIVRSVKEKQSYSLSLSTKNNLSKYQVFGVKEGRPYIA